MEASEAKQGSPATPRAPHLALLDAAVQHDFVTPAKKINEGEDVEFFLTSRAYGDILAWLLQLNAAMFPRKTESAPDVQAWERASDAVDVHPAAQSVADLLTQLDAAIAEAPPDTGPRRFGNVSFRRWYAIVEGRVDSLLNTCLGSSQTLLLHGDANKELRAYLLGSFGSAQRLDYGTGHELSFLAFLGGLWKLGLFGPASADQGNRERSIVLHAIDPYLDLVRKLILTYNLEPAGTHGVWGLDDHSFAPYIFGSAQLSPVIVNASNIPQEGSLSGAPDPGDVSKSASVERLRKHNMYFDAIGFIYDVKKGPFWEHSPMLFDISGVQAGWAKINKGMIKMYIAEVLSKFPVVQHFHFGHLFQWQRDPDAVLPASFTQRQAQTQTRTPTTMSAPPTTMSNAPTASSGAPMTAAPWAKSQAVSTDTPQTAASWARGSGAGIALPRRGVVSRAAATPDSIPGSRPAISQAQAQIPGSVMTRAAGGQDVPVTQAPWAKRQ